MSLFYIDEADELNELVQRMSKRQYEQSPELYEKLPERARRFMKRDFYYGISYLKSAIDLREEQIYTSYVRWTYEYLSYLMTYVTKEEMYKQCREFYIAMDVCIKEEIPKDQYEVAKKYIESGLHEIERIYREGFQLEREHGREEKYEQKIAEYLSIVLRKDSKKAMQYFLNLYQQGMRVDEIYLEVVQKVMRKIGELWFENKISVA